MRWLRVSLCAALVAAGHAYNLVEDFSGVSFFDRFDFYGFRDNLTHGNVTWVSREVASSKQLAYVNELGRAIIKVDTGNVLDGDLRDTVRLTSKQTYPVGSLFVIDLNHIPYGCSVWPAFWTNGQTWPEDGEIDIIESINLFKDNRMALHTSDNCRKTTPPEQIGQSIENQWNCNTTEGCVVRETQPGSTGKQFADGGGGVWATQFDAAGIFVWFFPRLRVPPSIAFSTSTSSIEDAELATWGPPSAAFPSVTCNMSAFSPQAIILDITLCGNWAGLGSEYGPACGQFGPTGLCYNDSVVGPGSPKYDNAFFDINFIRTYILSNTVLPPISSSQSSSLSSQSSTAASTSAPTSTPPATNPNGLSAGTQRTLGEKNWVLWGLWFTAVCIVLSLATIEW